MKRTCLLVLLLAGCGAIQPKPDAGTSFTTEHGPSWFGSAMKGAEKHCAKMGMREVHLGSDRMVDPLGADRALSRFECVAK